MPIVFHNGSNYDYQCIIKKLAEQLTFSRENTGFAVSIEKGMRIFDKNGEEISIKYMLSITIYW